MCGIVGYVGPRATSAVLLDGLKRLEYRGYDSAGIVVFDGDRLRAERAVGRLDRLERVLAGRAWGGQAGLGHTRWATHGAPTERNAHPHVASCGARGGTVAVVHNGIIENFWELKRSLLERGHRFSSETDTEVAAHLIEEGVRGGKDLLGAVRGAVGKLRGSFALGVLSDRFPGELVAARRSAPLVVGVGEGEGFVASDLPALLGYTRRCLYLEDGDLVRVTRGGPQVFDERGRRVVRKVHEVRWSPEQAEKGGYRHFMEKEIWEQPRALADTLVGRVNPGKGEVHLGEAQLAPSEARRVRKVLFLACGTSYHAALLGRAYTERLAGIEASAELASEFRYREPVVGRGTLAIAVSQSGETADTLAALKEARKRGAKTLGVVNVVGSTLAREADRVLYTQAGPEIGVASTKAFTTQVLALYLLAVGLGRWRGALRAAEGGRLLREALELPGRVERTLGAVRARVEAVARKHARARDVLYLGRGLHYPIALEGALKLKEIAYVHAEGYAAGEMKHGPIALIDPRVPVVVLAPPGGEYEKVVSNALEVKARGGRVVAVVKRGDRRMRGVAEDLIEVPGGEGWLGAVESSIPLQMLAYRVALERGTDIDRPRNLAKSVTVE